MSRHWWARFEFQPRDLWIGAYWRNTVAPDGVVGCWEVWVCVLPCFPLHVQCWYGVPIRYEDEE